MGSGARTCESDWPKGKVEEDTSINGYAACKQDMFPSLGLDRILPRLLEMNRLPPLKFTLVGTDACVSHMEQATWNVVSVQRNSWATAGMNEQAQTFCGLLSSCFSINTSIVFLALGGQL